jgi:hypothetical protein
MLRRFAHWIQPALLLAALLAIAWFLRQQWPALAAYPWRFDATWFTLACVLALITWAVEVTIWRAVLRLVGGELGYWPAVRIWFLSAVVRYVPGNIWQPLSLALHGRRHGIAAEATIASIALYQVIILLAAAPLAVVYLLWINTGALLTEWVRQVHWPLAVLLLLPIVVFLARPAWFMALLNWGLRRVGRSPLTQRLTAPALLGLIVAAAADWLLWGLTFAAFTFALVGAGASDPRGLWMQLTLSYPIAYAIGFLSLLTPSGFGVREGAFYLLLVPRLDGAVVTVVALAMRLWTTASELLGALLSAPFERGLRATQDTPPVAADPDLGGELP